jgi:hypothetical protein
MSEYGELVERARADDDVLGLILTGSRGRSFRVRPDSDHDVRLVLRDDAEDTYSTPHGSPVEVAVLNRSEFAGAGLPGSGSEWDRYSYVHCQLVLDKLDGEISRLVDAKAHLSESEARVLAAAALDDYVNSYYRAARNHQNDLPFEARLDAAESVGHVLTALFALHRRVRPFNKFLGWELRREPLGDKTWSVEVLFQRLQRIVGPGDPDEQHALFRDVEVLARAEGHGGVIDGWEPDVAWLRGDRR